MIRAVVLASALIVAAPAFAETPAAQPTAATPIATTPAPSAKMAAEAQRLDLNSATVAQLSAVKGFNKTVAEAIVKARPFKSVEDLAAKKIVSGDVLTAVKDQLIVR